MRQICMPCTLLLTSLRCSNLSITLIVNVLWMWKVHCFPMSVGVGWILEYQWLLTESKWQRCDTSLNLDWMFRNHLALKADQLHSGWQTSYPHSIMSTWSSSVGAIRDLVSGWRALYHQCLGEWWALNHQTHLNTPISSQPSFCAL